MQEKTFLQKLQSSDERTKRVWLVLSSFVVMTGVVYVWLAYFNTITAVPQVVANADQPSAQPSAGFSLGQTVRGGLAFAYDAVLDKLHAIENIFSVPRSYTITPH